MIKLNSGKKVGLDTKVRITGNAVYVDTTKFKPFRLRDIVKYGFHLEDVVVEAAE